MCQESSGSETADDLKENNLSTVLQMVQSFFYRALPLAVTCQYKYYK
jgi:hypothetical protein